MKNIQNTPFCYEEEIEPLLNELSDRVHDLRNNGKLTPEILNTIRKYFKIKNIYNSNAIEGNLLNVGETRQVVEMGLTITGKPLKDQAEATNLSQALDFLEDLAKNDESPITENDIRQIHTLILKGIDNVNAGAYRTTQVRISGSEYLPPSPEKVLYQMREFGEWLELISKNKYVSGDKNAFINAIIAHTWLVQIHPFTDGNGRVARLIMNLILMRSGYPIAIITKEDRMRYYDGLEASQTSDISPYMSLVIECVHESLEEYEKAVKEQKEKEEWAVALASRLDSKEEIRYRNEYELWKSAMELLKGYFIQNCESINESSRFSKIYFRDFGMLEIEKYLNLKAGESAKRTWFFRIDFRSGDKTARYLFFFGFPNYSIRKCTDITLHIAREDPPNAYRYILLEEISAPNVPEVVEIGYSSKQEQFVVRERNNDKIKTIKADDVSKQFFDEVIKLHFSN